MILDLKYLYIRSLFRKNTFTSPLPPQNTYENPKNIYIDFCRYKHRNFRSWLAVRVWKTKIRTYPPTCTSEEREKYPPPCLRLADKNTKTYPSIEDRRRLQWPSWRHLEWRQLGHFEVQDIQVRVRQFTPIFAYLRLFTVIMLFTPIYAQHKPLPFFFRRTPSPWFEHDECY